MKKILHLQLLPLLSGVQRVSLNEIIEVRDSHIGQYEFFVACSSEGELTKQLSLLGIKFFIIPELRRSVSPYHDLLALYKLYRLIQKHQFDIVHTHSSKTGFLGRLAAKIAGTTKIIHTVHGFSFPSAKNKINKSIYFLMEWLAKFATDELIVLNKSDYDISVKQIRFKPEIVNIIPNGVNVNKFKPRNNKSEIFRVVMVGRLWEQKNPMCLLKAAKKLLKEYSDIEFHFLGDGEFRLQMEQYIHCNGLKDNVKILGWSNKVDELLPTYDLSVLPSLWEGMPLAILEAQSCGLPVIATDIPGNSCLINNGVNGYLFPINEYLDLYEKIEYLYLNKEQYELLSKNARENIVENYSSSSRNQSVINLYEEIRTN